MGSLDEYIERLTVLPPASRRKAIAEAMQATAKYRWIPTAGPQTDAYFSEADELLFGGQAGGGKTELIIGLSLTAHQYSLVLRRTNGEAIKLLERYQDIIGNRDGLNETKGVWRVDGRVIDIGGCQLEVDKQKRKGIPHDLKCVGRCTPVLMANKTWKPAASVGVGDMVATLEGPRRVLRAFVVHGRPAVEMRVNRSGQIVTQIQASSHRVLTKDGWVSAVSCPSIPSVVRSYPSIYSPPTRSDVIGIWPALVQMIYPVLRRLRQWSNWDRLLEALSDLATLGHLHQLGCGVCAGRSHQEICCAAYCGLFSKSQPLPLSTFHQVHFSLAHRSILPGTDPPSPLRDASYARDASVLEDSMDHYSSYRDRGDELPLYPGGCLLATMDDRGLFLQPDDAERPNPTGYTDDDLGSTPRHIRQRHTYPHPYGKGIRSTAVDLGEASCSFLPVNIPELVDLEIEEVNHFITGGGIINQNCFDELVDFTKSQYEFITAWTRSADPKQRTRIVATTNPPTRPEGMWVVERWAAWLDPKHPNPAKSGELRWYTNINGKDTEVDGPGPHDNGSDKMVMAKSRTFIRSRLDDNPDLTQTSDYQDRLNALPEELREAYAEGKFDVGLRDAPNQAIPTAWIRAAMDRWTEHAPDGVPMCGMGVDCSGGGVDPMMIAIRYDGWYDKLVEIPGKDIPPERPGKYAAGMVLSYRRDNAIVVVDMGGGYGGPTYEQLHDNAIPCQGYKGAEKSVRRTADGQLRFYNKRSETIWKFREALDPAQPHGSHIALPPDPILLADLAAPGFWTTKIDGQMALQIEDKLAVCARLGRSTDRGDAVVMGYSAGPTYITDGDMWRAAAESGIPGRYGRALPKVVMSPQRRRH